MPRPSDEPVMKIRAISFLLIASIQAKSTS
jgi:hypothetical protein